MILQSMPYNRYRKAAEAAFSWAVLSHPHTDGGAVTLPTAQSAHTVQIFEYPPVCMIMNNGAWK